MVEIKKEKYFFGLLTRKIEVLKEDIDLYYLYNMIRESTVNYLFEKQAKKEAEKFINSVNKKYK